MAGIPLKNKGDRMVEMIYQAIEEEDGREQWLTRIGASSIGDECRRSLWYSWRGFTHELIEGRVLRLFKTGHLQEDRIVEDLQRAGAEVWAIDETTGKQFTWLDETGHYVTKPDGVIKWPPFVPVPFVLEIKTHNDKSFQALRKNGVVASKPEHVWQMNSAMWLSGLTGAVYVSLNKNDEDYHIEVLPRDELIIKRLYENKQAVITATIPPARVSETQSHYQCRWCDHLSVCSGYDKPLRNCRTCLSSEPLMENGEWVCTKHGNILDRETQKVGCEDYESY